MISRVVKAIFSRWIGHLPIVGCIAFGLFCTQLGWSDGSHSDVFASATTGVGVSLNNTGITSHKITWNVTGTVTGCTVQLDSSADGVTWNSGDIIAGQTCTSNGVSSLTLFTANFVRAHMTAFSGTGNVNVTWNGFVVAPPNLSGNNTFSGTNSFGTTQTDVANGVCGVGTGSASPKYANIAAAVADSNCTTIEVAAKSGCYSETWTSGLTTHGTLVIHFKGCATINQNGNNPLTHPGGSANDSITIFSDFPIGGHANGTNSGVTFTGYTGTACVMSFGSATSATLNITVRGINLDVSSGGTGSCGIDLINTASNDIEDINCNIKAASSVCILLDGGGSGGFTKTTHILRGNFTGNTGANQSLIKGQNGAPDTYIQGGDYNVNGTGGICWDAESNSVEFHMQGANCDTAAKAIQEVGAANRITGWYRIDSGVTALGTVTSGSYQAFCENCSFNSPLLTDSTNTAAHFTPDGLDINSTLWRLVCTGTSCSIKDNAGGGTPLQINTGGNMFLGTVTQVVLDNNGIPTWPNSQKMTESAAPAGVAAKGVFWSDSSDHMAKYNPNNTGEQHVPQIYRLTVQYTNSTTGFTTVGTPNIAFPVNANQNYIAVCHLYYQAAATGGLNIEFTGPATPTAVHYGLLLPVTTGTAPLSTEIDAFAASLGAVVGTAATNFDATVSFTLINGANAGTVTLLAKSSAAVQLQIQIGSFCQVQ